jgi:hypothetical protein
MRYLQQLGAICHSGSSCSSKGSSKEPMGRTDARAPKRGIPTPATIGLAQVYGRSESEFRAAVPRYRGTKHDRTMTQRRVLQSKA